LEAALSNSGKPETLSTWAKMRKIAVASAINFESLKMQIRTTPPCSFYSYKKDCPGNVSVSVPMNVVNVVILLEPSPLIPQG
jgi:hypothetical protein